MLPQRPTGCVVIRDWGIGFGLWVRTELWFWDYCLDCDRKCGQVRIQWFNCQSGIGLSILQDQLGLGLGSGLGLGGLLGLGQDQGWEVCRIQEGLGLGILKVRVRVFTFRVRIEVRIGVRIRVVVRIGIGGQGEWGGFPKIPSESMKELDTIQNQSPSPLS